MRRRRMIIDEDDGDDGACAPSDGDDGDAPAEYDEDDDPESRSDDDDERPVAPPAKELDERAQMKALGLIESDDDSSAADDDDDEEEHDHEEDGDEADDDGVKKPRGRPKGVSTTPVEYKEGCSREALRVAEGVEGVAERAAVQAPSQKQQR